MSLGDHLEELRTRLIRALIGIAITSAITLYFGRHLVAWIIRPLAQVLRSQGFSPTAQFFSPATAFTIYIKVSLIAGLIVALPWVLYQLWKFIESGLYAHERRVAMTLLPFSSFMAALGVLFMYYIMLPVCLVFLIGFAGSYPAPDMDTNPTPNPVMHWITDAVASYAGSRTTDDAPADDADDASDAGPSALAQPEADAPTPPALTQLPILSTDPATPTPGQAWIKMPERELRIALAGKTLSYAPIVGVSLLQPNMEIGQYISFVTLLTLGMVVAFQLPVAMLILGWTGLVSPQMLHQYRKYCVFGCFALGAVFTPADPISMFILAMPLWLLFEVGLVLMRVTYRKPEAPLV